MSQVERNGHQVLRLVGGIAEHHTLVACTLLVLIAIIYTAVDILTLLMDGSQDTTGITIKLVFGLGIANSLNGVTSNGLQVDIHLTAYLTHDDYLTCCYKRLTGHTGVLVVSQELVQDGITYLIGHLIGMAL